MSQRNRIDSVTLRKIVKEELKQLREAVDHAAIRDVVTAASKLLESISDFKEAAPASAINSVTPHLSELEKVLEDMVSTPGSYVPRVKQEPKTVSLRAVKDGD